MNKINILLAFKEYVENSWIFVLNIILIYFTFFHYLYKEIVCVIEGLLFILIERQQIKDNETNENFFLKLYYILRKIL